MRERTLGICTHHEYHLPVGKVIIVIGDEYGPVETVTAATEHI